MSRVKKFVRRHKKIAIGMHAAMVMWAHAKGTASIHPNETSKGTSQTLPPQLRKKKIRFDSAALAKNAIDESKELVAAADIVWETAVKLATETAGEETEQANEQIDPSLRPDQARLWLQAYNAGPYALLKYKGHVPYKETMNYSPRVFKYYQQDLSNTPYESIIVSTARKYGLDPQMIRAIMKTESDFDNSTVSHAGARGLMQVMPVVWKDIKARYKLDWDYEAGVFDPAKNIEISCAYLAWLRYDFLPRHFAEFEPNPQAPSTIVHDNAPPRKTPRILASAFAPAVKAATAMNPAFQTKEAVEGVKRALEQKSKKSSDKAKVEVASSKESKAKQTKTESTTSSARETASAAKSSTKKPAAEGIRVEVAKAKVTRPSSSSRSSTARASVDPSKVRIAEAGSGRTVAKRPSASSSRELGHSALKTAKAIEARLKAEKDKAAVAAASKARSTSKKPDIQVSSAKEDKPGSKGGG